MTEKRVRNDEDDGFARIPHWFQREAVPAFRLRAPAVAVYGALVGRANKRGECWPALRTIGTEAGLSSDNAVAKAIARLIECELIEVVSRRANGSNLYRVKGRPMNLALRPHEMRPKELRPHEMRPKRKGPSDTHEMRPKRGQTSKTHEVSQGPSRNAPGGTHEVRPKQIQGSSYREEYSAPRGAEYEETQLTWASAPAPAPVRAPGLPHSHQPSPERVALLHDLEVLGDRSVPRAGFHDGLSAPEVEAEIAVALEIVVAHGTPHGCAMSLPVGRPELWGALKSDSVRALLRENCDPGDVVAALVALVHHVGHPPHVAAATISHEPIDARAAQLLEGM